MKKRAFTLLAASAGLLLAGCLVTSVCPYYTTKDLVFEPALVGDWLEVDDNSNNTWKFQKSEPQAYRLILVESQKATVMNVHAFKLQDQLFLDLASIDTDVRVIPPHYLLEVVGFTPTLKLAQLDNDWLKSYLAKHPHPVAHHLVQSSDNPDDLRVVLTASTSDLQKFVLEHLKTKDAWTSAVELKREAVSIAQQQAGK